MTTLARATQLVPLLSYCLADVADAAAAVRQLPWLRLLPLSNGDVGWLKPLRSDSSSSSSGGGGDGRMTDAAATAMQSVFIVTEQLELLLVSSVGAPACRVALQLPWLLACIGRCSSGSAATKRCVRLNSVGCHYMQQANQNPVAVLMPADGSTWWSLAAYA